MEFQSSYYTHSSRRWLCLGGTKSLHVCRTLLSSQADLSKIAIWMVSILPLNSSSSNPFFQTFGGLFQMPQLQLVSTLMFQRFFNSLARSSNFSIFLLTSIFTLWSEPKNPLDDRFLLINGRSSLLVEIKWPFISQNSREFYASHSLETDSGLYIYLLVGGSNFNLFIIIIIIILIIIILLLWEIFSLALADDFSLEFEWQQVSSSPQDSS